jgi:hypothetical protein
VPITGSLGTDSGDPIVTDDLQQMAVQVALTITTGGLVGPQGASSSAIDITAATVLKTGAGQVVTVNVTTAGSAPGAVYDFAETTGETSSNLVGVIPEAVGSYPFNGFPCFTGILVVPGTGQVLSVAFS